MMKTQELRRIARFALFGAIGFGAGGAVAGGIQQAISSPYEMFAIIVFFFTIPVWGAIAGLVLGLAFWERSKVITLSLLGAIGLPAGGLIGTLVILAGMDLEVVGWAVWIAWFGVTSIVIAWVLGFGIWRDWRNWRKMLVLALAGALGFGLGEYIIGTFGSLMLMGWRGLSWMWVGIIGGASVGAALGYLERGRQTSA